MDLGIFVPTGNNGWFMSTSAPQYPPTFALNRRVVRDAEAYGLEFALAMVKLRGFGGATRFWDENLESIVLVAGLAAVTRRIRLFASVAVLTIPPAIVARMVATIDDISDGRAGLNIVGGWQKAEYDQMGLWPGSEHFARRYEYCAEYVTVLRELLATGQSDFKGRYFTMNDCRLAPRPAAPVPIVCAGQSPGGMRFAAAHGDYNFCVALGTNTPTGHAAAAERLRAAAATTGRTVGLYVLVMIIAAATDGEAFARWQRYRDGADLEALAWVAAQAGENGDVSEGSVIGTLTQSEGAISLNIGRLIGSYGTVARMLDEMGEVEGTSGLMLILEDYRTDMVTFGTRIQPLMQSRRHVRVAA
jgi:pyrimidine oxygenase